MSSLDLRAWTVENSRARRCKRWSVFGPDIIDMTVAEMDLPTAAPIIDSVRDAVERQSFGYPIPERLSDLPDVASQWLTERGLTVASDDIRMLSDVIKGMVLALQHLGPADASVAIVTPTYSRFFDAVEAAGRCAVEVPMRRVCGRHRLDLDAIDVALADGASVVLLCNPSNPVGSVFDREELRGLSATVERHGARVISDEVHSPLTYDGAAVPYASVNSEARSHSITLTSASKAWNIPGLRCAVAVITNPVDQESWDRLPRASKGGISPLGVEATVAAFRHGQEWLDDAINILDANRRMIVERLEGEGFGNVMGLPEATYLGWLDLRQFGFDDACRELQERAGVATTAGSEHGASGAGFVRLNFASPVNTLEEALDRIVTVLHGRTVSATA